MQDVLRVEALAQVHVEDAPGALGEPEEPADRRAARLGALRERFGGKRKLIVDFAQTYESVEMSEAQIIARDGMRATYQFERGTITASELIGRLSASYRIRDDLRYSWGY